MTYSLTPKLMSACSLMSSAASFCAAHVLLSVMGLVRVVRHGAHFSPRKPLNAT